MIKQYKCPKCGHTYDLMPNHPLPMDDNLHYASHLHQGIAEYFCHICLYEFLAEVYNAFLLEEVK